MEHKLKQLTRSERTHRLCTRAGMLEKFLREPTLLTDDDVMELLIFIFHGEAVQKKLDLLIEKREKEATTEDGEVYPLVRGRNYTPPKDGDCVLPKAEYDKLKATHTELAGQLAAAKEELQPMILSILVDIFISKISFPMQ